MVILTIHMLFFMNYSLFIVCYLKFPPWLVSLLHNAFYFIFGSNVFQWCVSVINNSLAFSCDIRYHVVNSIFYALCLLLWMDQIDEINTPKGFMQASDTMYSNIRSLDAVWLHYELNEAFLMRLTKFWAPINTQRTHCIINT